jgi:hypothetical protein
MSDAKHLIGYRLFCTSSQSGLIYSVFTNLLPNHKYYELMNFAVDSLILLLHVCNLPEQSLQYFVPAM